MDRLTWQPPNYYGYFTPKDGIDGMDCVQKLAEYEDTGLSPAEVAELVQANAWSVAGVKSRSGAKQKGKFEKEVIED